MDFPLDLTGVVFSIMLAAKFYDDIYYNNAYYAKVPIVSMPCSFYSNNGVLLHVVPYW